MMSASSVSGTRQPLPLTGVTSFRDSKASARMCKPQEVRILTILEVNLRTRNPNSMFRDENDASGIRIATSSRDSADNGSYDERPRQPSVRIGTLQIFGTRPGIEDDTKVSRDCFGRI